MSESRLWDVIEKKLKKLHPVRIENLVGEGQPDVNYVGGWIELKDPARLPMRDGGLRPSQKVWIRSRLLAGGVVWLCVRVLGVIYFFNLDVADIDAVNGWTYDNFRDACDWRSDEGTWAELVGYLQVIPDGVS